MILRHSLVSCIDQVKDKGMSQDCELTLYYSMDRKQKITTLELMGLPTY